MVYAEPDRDRFSLADSGAAPRLGVVIPAHDEETVIDRCLSTLLADARPGEFDVLVVANGCADRTATVARGFGVRVIEIAEPGKANAVALGDRHVHCFPKLFLDADVELDSGSARALAQALQRPGALAAAPNVRYCMDGVSAAARSAHRVHATLMAGRRSLAGNGVYGVSRDGHSRIFPLPTVIADDGWVDRSFDPDEREILPGATSVVRPARTVRALLRRRVRVRLGNRQLDAAGRPEHREPFRLATLAELVADGRVGWRDAAVYVGVVLADRVLTWWRRHDSHVGWGTDVTSRASRPTGAGAAGVSVPIQLVAAPEAEPAPLRVQQM